MSYTSGRSYGAGRIYSVPHYNVNSQNTGRPGRNNASSGTSSTVQSPDSGSNRTTYTPGMDTNPQRGRTSPMQNASPQTPGMIPGSSPETATPPRSTAPDTTFRTAPGNMSGTAPETAPGSMPGTMPHTSPSANQGTAPDTAGPGSTPSETVPRNTIPGIYIPGTPPSDVASPQIRTTPDTAAPGSPQAPGMMPGSSPADVTVPNTMPGTAPGSMPQTGLGTMPDTMPRTVPGTMPRTAPGTTPGTAGETAPGTARPNGAPPSSVTSPQRSTAPDTAVPGGPQAPNMMPGSGPSGVTPPRSAAPGTTPGTAPRTMPGTAPGTMPGTSPGTMPRTAPGTTPGISPDMTPGSAPGTMPGGMNMMINGMETIPGEYGFHYFLNSQLPVNNPYKAPLGIPLYPLYGYDSCEELDKDSAYMKQLYPSRAKSILPYIENECDQLEYDGSVMFDEYPDKVTLDRIVDRIYEKVKDMDEDAQLEAKSIYLYPQRRSRGNIRDIISLLLLNEIFNRRRRYRSRRRWF